MITVTGRVQDVTGRPDNSLWTFASVLRGGSEDGVIVTTTPREVYPRAGLLTVELDPGIAVVKYSGRTWTVTVPHSDIALWDLIATGAGQ